MHITKLTTNKNQARASLAASISNMKTLTKAKENNIFTIGLVEDVNK